MIKISKTIIAVIAIVGVVAFLYFYFDTPNYSIDVSKGKINKVETMAQLCAIDIYNEIPILDTINDKVICAIQKQKGSVSFDLENMKIDAKGDTVNIVLSPEIIEIYEATEDNSWEVIDTKTIGMFTTLRNSRLNEDEENAVKANIKKNSKKLLYHNGTIERARTEGARNLQTLMEKVYRKPVVVTDPTPKGAHYNEYR